MQFQKLSFKNSEGKTLSARLDLPADERPRAYAIFAHCFTCTKNLNAVVHINRAMAREGIAVLRFDFTGLGESEGDFSETNFSSNVADLQSAAEFLESNYEAPVLLVGHSFGGAAVLQAAGRISSVRAVATIGAPADQTHVLKFLGHTREEIEKKGEADVKLGLKTFKIRKQFFDDIGESAMEKTLQSLSKPLLIFHSPIDSVVEFSNALDIFQRAEQPKSLVSLDQADHLLSSGEDSEYVGAVLAAWAGKYMGLKKEPEKEKDPEDNRTIVRTGRFGYQTEINANGHRFMADEPIAVGGADTGPTPYDLLTAALGACTSMTLRMYADRRSLPLEAVVVRLKHRKVHMADCQDCEKDGRKIDTIDREIELAGPLEEDQKKRLLEIADRCPVHRTLQSRVLVQSRLKESSQP